MQEQQPLLSHSIAKHFTDKTIHDVRQRILNSTDKNAAVTKQQLNLLNELTQFDLGLFLLQNRGLNGYWTHYVLTHPWLNKKTAGNNQKETLSNLENFLLNRAPTALATQQRFEIFLTEIQKQVKNNATLACIPCGMMGELLYLNFDGIKNIELIGIDYDPGALQDADSLAKKQKLSHFVTLIEQDAWQLEVSEKFDLISSNGLNIYMSDDGEVIKLYKQFYNALKKNGKLITSFLTPPPNVAEQCEWNFKEINQDDLLLQKTIFVDIINAKWHCYRSTQQTEQQLKLAGFKNIHFIYDKACLFPTVIAEK